MESIWEYGDGAPRRVSADSLRFIRAMSRAADGRVAYFALFPSSPGPWRAQVVELSRQGAPLRTLDVGLPDLAGSTPIELAYSPDGTRLAWHSVRADASDSLYVLDAGSTTPRGIAVRPWQETIDDQLLPNPPMRWTPGGRIVFGRTGSLRALNVSGTDTLTLTTNEGYIHDYDFAPDGRLAVVSFVPGQSNRRLRTQRAVGGPLIQVTGSAAANPSAVRWTIDGRRVATTAVDSTFELGQWQRFAVPSLVTPDGSEPAIRVSGVAAGEFQGWTSDGRLLVLGVAQPRDGSSTDVWAIRFGTGATNLTRTASATELAAIPVR